MQSKFLCIRQLERSNKGKRPKIILTCLYLLSASKLHFISFKIDVSLGNCLKMNLKLFFTIIFKETETQTALMKTTIVMKNIHEFLPEK